MTTFLERDMRHLEREGITYGTIEIGRASTRHGMVVRIEGLTSGILWRTLLESAFDVAGRSTPVRPSEAGWWAGIICAAALMEGRSPVVLRPGELDQLTGTGRHVWMRLEPARMLEAAPAWPMVKLAPTMPWLDLRGETCLAHGPTDAELRAYVDREGIHVDVSLHEIRALFEIGVLEWSKPERVSGQRQVQRAK